MKRTHKDELPDVAADDPKGTMERFTDGLKRVLIAPKADPKRKHPKRKSR